MERNAKIQILKANSSIHRFSKNPDESKQFFFCVATSHFFLFKIFQDADRWRDRRWSQIGSK